MAIHLLTVDFEDALIRADASRQFSERPWLGRLDPRRSVITVQHQPNEVRSITLGKRDLRGRQGIALDMGK